MLHALSDGKDEGVTVECTEDPLVELVGNEVVVVREELCGSVVLVMEPAVVG